MSAASGTIWSVPRIAFAAPPPMPSAFGPLVMQVEAERGKALGGDEDEDRAERHDAQERRDE